MRSLDEFYKYIDKQEKAVQKQAPPPSEITTDEGSGAASVDSAAPAMKTQYIIRNGLTVAVKVPATTVPDPDPASYFASPITIHGENGLASTRELSAPGHLPPPPGDRAEPPEVADAPPRPRPPARRRGGANEAATPGPVLTERDVVVLWQRLPRHIQLLVAMTEPEAQTEVAQKYYRRGFKETRQQLLQRLLDPTLTLEDTARVLGVCPATVRRYTNRGVLPHHRTVGQQRRFRLSDVLAFGERADRATAAEEDNGDQDVRAAS